MTDRDDPSAARISAAGLFSTRCTRPAAHAVLIAGALACFLSGCRTTSPAAGAAARNRVIVFVWDGLRPDSITPSETPNLHALRIAGVDFADHHATYPTFTMINAATLATGAFPRSTGFYGNWVLEPRASGADSAGRTLDFRQPVFTEDWAVLQDLDDAYAGRLFLVSTLFEAARDAGLTTVTVGKSGPAFLQDRHTGGIVIDEKAVWPLALALEMKAAGRPLPATSHRAHPSGGLTLSADNGNPTAFMSRPVLADGVTIDPTADAAPYASSNAYLMRTYLEVVLPKRPDLSVIWLRSPDSEEHSFGPGSPGYHAALRAQDESLGTLRRRLSELGLASTTNLIVVSDHAHSTVSGPPSLFPLRTVAGGKVGELDPRGWSVSGEVRLADLLRRAGFTAYDGFGCLYAPVLSGIRADGTPARATLTDDAQGSACGKPGQRYTTPAAKVPRDLPPHTIVIAANGGSDYLYVPDHDVVTVSRAVAFLQSRGEIGAVFVASRYGKIAGALSLDQVNLEDHDGRHPDVVVSYAFDENVSVAGMPGISFQGQSGFRGMHGSFSPVDVHNTLVAFGPDFKREMKDLLPTGNVDVAPTVARILGVPLPGAEGRPLLEALAVGGVDASSYAVSEADVAPERPATGLVMRSPTNPDGLDVDVTLTTYTVKLHTKTLTRAGRSNTYFEWARAVRGR